MHADGSIIYCIVVQWLHPQLFRLLCVYLVVLAEIAEKKTAPGLFRKAVVYNRHLYSIFTPYCTHVGVSVH